MKGKQMVIFFLIVLAVNLLVNLYLYFRTKVIFPDSPGAWWAAALFFWLIAFSYVIGRIFERYVSMELATPFVKTGSIWLGAMVYLTLLFLLADIVRGLNSLFGITDFLSFSWNSGKGGIVVGAVYALTTVILIAGYYSARNPVVRTLALETSKIVPGGKQRVVLVSDIHLGMMISNNSLKRMVDLVNQQQADLILLAGDVFDEDLGPVIKNNNGDLLKKLYAKNGVYAILGNHEFYGNADVAEKYLKNHNITVLRDSVVSLENGIVIAGREDITAERMFGMKRKTINELLGGVNSNNLLFMLDHQPYNLADVASHEIDLQVSGHTHNGQMWPFNYITSAIFEISSGYGKIEDTHFYVSSGYGTWGPPFRTNSRSEIIVLDITGTK